MLDTVLRESNAAAIIFDMDGTLVDNMDFHRQTWILWADREGLRLTEPELLVLTHGTIGEIVARLFPGDSDPQSLHERGERKEALYRELYAPHLALLPGLKAFLDEAKAAAIPMAVATAGDWTNIAFTLDGLGIRDYFGAIVGGEDVAHGKPHPEVFLLAAQKLGVPPERCLVFEDSLAGVEAARRANMTCIVVNPMTPRETFTDAAHVLHFARDYNDLDFQTSSV